MNKRERTKFVKQIKEAIGENYRATDDLLIDKLIMWCEISTKAEQDLMKAVDERGEMPWSFQTTIAMASKQIQSLYTKLGITPQERAKIRVVEKERDVDLSKLLG
jgi:hypothetical protein